MTTNNRSLLSDITLLTDVVLCTMVYTAIVLAKGLISAPGAKSSIAIVGLVCLYVAFSRDTILYKKDTHNWQIVILVLKNILQMGVFSALLLYVSHTSVLSAMELSGYYALAFVMSCLIRLSVSNIVKAYRRQPRNQTPVILVGNAPSSIDLYNEITKIPTLGYRVAGYFCDEPSAHFPQGCQWLGTTGDVFHFLDDNHDVRSVYCSLPSSQKDYILSLIHYCEKNMVAFYNVPSIRDYMHSRMYLNMIGTAPVLGMYNNPWADAASRMKKRAFDIVFSLLFLCTLFPFVFLIVAIITKCTMPGPIFFKQKRSGQNNRPFDVIKFRSMVVNDSADTVQATKDDPRKTRWGDIMRKTNIDELPQFINVLKGEMSVVGPRPHMLKHTEEYSKLIDKYMVRHIAKPGITGWSQVTGFRGETKELWQMEGRIKGDLWYIQHWSMGLDLVIILKTILNILHGEKEAY